MNIRNYLGLGLTTIALTGSLFLSGCNEESQSPPKKLEQRISQEATTQNNLPDKYAVLISGKTDYRHKENLSLAYQVLLENGFQRENVYILDNHGEKTAFYPVDDTASKEKIEMIFEHLSKKVDSKDMLFVYTTDHGGRATIKEKVNGETKNVKVSKLIIPGEDLLETEMRSYLNNINPKTGVLVFDQCNSGGFAKRAGKGNYIGISASEADKDSYLNTFPQTFFGAWRDSNADQNGDGKFSIKEVFDYTLQNDKKTKSGSQKPQIFSEINPDKVFLK